MDYKLFTITAVDQNYGGIGTVTYNLSDYFTGRVLIFLQEHLILLILLQELFLRSLCQHLILNWKPNDFSNGEIVTGSISSTRGIVQNWNPNTGILRYY